MAGIAVGDADAQDERNRDPVQARRKAMDYLARRDHGRQELQSKLEAAGFDGATAQSAVEQLAREGLQSDQRFLESFVQSRINQGKGPVRIRLELRQHGIEEPLVDDCLESSDEDWADLASRIRVRKFKGGPPRDFREKARQMRFLQYRGFETEHIQRALEAGDGD